MTSHTLFSYLFKIRVWDGVNQQFLKNPGQKLQSRVAVTGRFVTMGDRDENFKNYFLFYRRIRNGRGYFTRVEWS